MMLWLREQKMEESGFGTKVLNEHLELSFE